jgi:hypothetical protein
MRIFRIVCCKALLLERRFNQKRLKCCPNRGQLKLRIAGDWFSNDSRKQRQTCRIDLYKKTRMIRVFCLSSRAKIGDFGDDTKSSFGSIG